MFDSVIHRTAPDDFYALKTAVAIQRCEHCDVLALTPMNSGDWKVWAKFDSKKITTSEIDKLIEAMLDAAHPTGATQKR